jgi:hypothetical protein
MPPMCIGNRQSASLWRFVHRACEAAGFGPPGVAG